MNNLFRSSKASTVSSRSRRSGGESSPTELGMPYERASVGNTPTIGKPRRQSSSSTGGSGLASGPGDRYSGGGSVAGKPISAPIDNPNLLEDGSGAEMLMQDGRGNPYGNGYGNGNGHAHIADTSMYDYFNRTEGDRLNAAARMSKMNMSMPNASRWTVGTSTPSPEAEEELTGPRIQRHGSSVSQKSTVSSRTIGRGTGRLDVLPEGQAFSATDRGPSPPAPALAAPGHYTHSRRGSGQSFASYTDHEPHADGRYPSMKGKQNLTVQSDSRASTVSGRSSGGGYEMYSTSSRAGSSVSLPYKSDGERELNVDSLAVEEIDARYEELLLNRQLTLSSSKAIDPKQSEKLLLQLRSVPLETKKQMLKAELDTKKSRNGSPSIMMKQNELNSPKYFATAFQKGKMDLGLLNTLEVALRGNDKMWMTEFQEEYKGTNFIASKLEEMQRIPRRTEEQLDIERTCLKCLAHYCNMKPFADGLIAEPLIIDAIISSIMSPRMDSRLLASQMATFLAYFKKPDGYDAVLASFGRYQMSIPEDERPASKFSRWFEVVERSMSRHGQFGYSTKSEYNVSTDETSRGSRSDQKALEAYALQTMYLINCLMNALRGENDPASTGLKRRMHIRVEYDQAGVKRVLEALNRVKTERLLELELYVYAETQQEDELENQARMKNDNLLSLGNAREVLEGLLEQTHGSKSAEHLLSILRHLTLIDDDPADRDHGYELIAKMITGITMDGQMGRDKDFASVVGFPLRQIYNHFDTQSSLDTALGQIDDLERKNRRLERHKKELEQELARSNEGLTGQLKEQLQQAEDRLRVARGNNVALQEANKDILAKQKVDDENLRQDVYELIEMLVETGQLEEVIQRQGRYRKDRIALVNKYEEQKERAFAIRTLEGRDKRNPSINGVRSEKDAIESLGDDDGEGDRADDAQIVRIARAQKVPLGLSMRRTRTIESSQQPPKAPDRSSGSQFVDADDAHVSAHIAERLAVEQNSPSSSKMKGQLPRSARSRNVNFDALPSPTGRITALGAPPIGQKSAERYSSIRKDAGMSRVMTELRNRHIGRSSSAPAHMSIADDDEETIASATRDSGFSVANHTTPATSVSSMHSRSGSNTESAFAGQLAAKAKSLGGEGLALSLNDGVDEQVTLPTVSEIETEVGVDSEEDDGPPPPPPPPPPPMPAHLAGPGRSAKPTLDDDDEEDGPPPPPPPPPPPMPGMHGGRMPSASGMPAGLLAGIAGGFKLRKVGESGDDADDGAPPPPPPPMLRSGSKRYSSVNRTAPAGERRKDVPLTAGRKMKQLQWEKVNRSGLEKTVWGQTAELPQDQWAVQLKRVDIWSEMEDEFKAREVAADAVAKRKKEELKSLLEPSVRKHIEILMNRTKRLEPEQLCEQIGDFDKSLCDNTFLSELHNLIPTPEQVALLKQHSAETPEELAMLHPADRLMLRLIKIPFLADRIQGMLYQVNFEESVVLLEKGVDLLQRACEDLRNANQFKALLNVILMMGNYMNGSNYGGGAYGFKIASINRLVDTKSSNGQNLLHFLERTISQQFPEMLAFRSELEKPAEAYRVSLEEISSGSRELLNGLQKIRRDLEARMLNADDGYTRRMFPFTAVAEDRVEALRDMVQAGARAFNEVKQYYGEGDDKYDAVTNPVALSRPTSLEFFGTFKAFVTSYDLCRAQNKAREDAKIALERRRQADRARMAALTPQTTGTSTASDQFGTMDDLQARLRMQGTPRAKRSDRRRARDMPSTPSLDQFEYGGGGFDNNNIESDPSGNDLADMAARMLNQLGSSENRDSIVSSTASDATDDTQSRSASPRKDLFSPNFDSTTTPKRQRIVDLTSDPEDPSLAAGETPLSPETPDITITQSSRPSSFTVTASQP